MMISESKSEIKFSDVILDWLEQSQLGFRYSTYAKYRNLATTHIFPYFGTCPLIQIERGDILRFFQDMSRNGRVDGNGGLSSSTLKSLSIVIRSSLQFAFEQNYIDHIYTKIPLSSDQKSKIQVISPGDQILLEKSLRREMDLSKCGILICLYAGLRLGELCGLQWADVDFQEELLHVNRTVQRLPVILTNNSRESACKTYLNVSRPKTRTSLRTIPIPTFVLRQLHNFYEGQSSDTYLLSNSPHRPMDPRTYQHRYKRYLEEAGLSYINFHALRHTFATRCISLGVDVKTLSEILGHSNIQTTLEYYVHSSLEMKKQQMKKLTALT